MKNLIKKTVLLIGTVCLCFLGMVFYGPYREAQASTFSVNSASALVSYCARTGTHTINLTANIDLAQTAVIGEDCNITINGNGYTITQKGPENTFKIESGGSLTISNTTVDRSLYPDTAVCLFVEAGGNLIVESGTYKASNSTVADIGVKELHGTQVVGGFGMVTINGGTFTGSMADFYAVGLCGQYNYVINGGEFTNSTSGVGTNLYPHPYKEAKNSVTINGGDFHHNKNNGITVGCPSGSQAGTTTATVNGGSFHDNGLNGISVIDVNQTCSIKRANVYNNKHVGVLTGGGTVEFISTSADAAYLNIYNNGVITGYHNVYVQQGGKFIGGYANIYNNGSYLDKSTGIGVNLGTVTVKEGINIKDCKGGVQTFGPSAVVTIDGGYINGCTTGVNLDYGGTCTINNANITGNGVGIDADMSAVLEVTKGTITNNTTGIWCEARSKTTLAGSSAGAIVIAGNSSEGIKVSHSATFSGAHLALLAP